MSVAEIANDLIAEILISLNEIVYSLNNAELPDEDRQILERGETDTRNNLIRAQLIRDRNRLT